MDKSRGVKLIFVFIYRQVSYLGACLFLFYPSYPPPQAEGKERTPDETPSLRVIIFLQDFLSYLYWCIFGRRRVYLILLFLGIFEIFRRCSIRVLFWILFWRRRRVVDFLFGRRSLGVQRILGFCYRLYLGRRCVLILSCCYYSWFIFYFIIGFSELWHEVAWSGLIVSNFLILCIACVLWYGLDYIISELLCNIRSNFILTGCPYW